MNDKMNNFVISPSPHVHGNDSIEKNMYGVLIALIPALIFSIIFFGFGAIIVTSVSIASCLLFEYLIAKFLLKSPNSIWDGSAIITGALLAFNLPANIPIWIIIIGAFVAIGIGKMSFGGLGTNIFNPALIGRVYLLISFPVQMTTWPIPKGFATSYIDAETGATPLAMMKAAVKGGSSFTEALSSIGIDGYLNIFVGNIGGSMGELSAIAIIIGLCYMLIKKIITWHIPITIFLTVAIFTGILHIVNHAIYADPLYHLGTGGIMLGAVFMATDYTTSPMSNKGSVIYAVGIGIITVLIRLFGAYPEGISFAILIMNAFTPLINRYCKPKRFA